MKTCQDIDRGYQLPMRMTECIDDVEIGAYIKRMSDDARAIVIDYTEQGLGGCFLAAMAKRKFREGNEDNLPSRPGDFKIVKIKKPDEWMVLIQGHGGILVE